jgi:tRNA threonylcarbamoyladenosine biosynthesis protein TsaB
MILAIDTSGQNLGLAIAANGKCGHSLLLKPGLKHGEILQNTIAEFIHKAGTEFDQLTAIAVTLGPGSFTGLRIGMAAAKAYSYALNVPLTGISTLEAAAYAVTGANKPVVVLFDAKRNEIYWAAFDCSQNIPVRLTPDAVGPIAPLNELADEEAIFFGPQAFEGIIKQRFGVSDYRENDDFNLAVPAALSGEQDLIRGLYLDRDELTPIYLRN